MTNFGALAILALPRKHAKMLTPDEADLRLLLALETFTEDASGWRSVGMEKLARSAGVPYGTARRSCDRLVASGLVARESGNGSGRGKGTYTRWRLLFPLKVPSQGEHLKVRVPTQGEHLNGAIRCSPDPVKVLTQPRKGAHPDSLTSGNAAPALGSSALGTSALSPGAATPADPAGTGDERETDPGQTDPLVAMLAAAVPDAGYDDIEYTVTGIKTAAAHGEIRSAVAVIRGAIRDGYAAGLIGDARSERAHRKAFLDAIEAQMGDRPRRRECEHGRPYTLDGTDCDPPCVLGDLEGSKDAQFVPDDAWPPPEPIDVDLRGDPC